MNKTDNIIGGCALVICGAVALDFGAYWTGGAFVLVGGVVALLNYFEP